MIAAILRFTRRRDFSAWYGSEWWHGAGNDNRFVPVGQRETGAYVAGLRDAIRFMEAEMKFRWHDEGAEIMKDYKRAVAISIHVRAQKYQERML